MKTKKLLIILTVFFSVSVYADFIPVESAKKVAHNFYYEKYNQFEGSVLYNQLEITSTYTRAEKSENFFYAFHFNYGGFVIVPAEDCLSPVLGYSFKHNFVAENQPANVQYWFSQYEDQILFARKNRVNPEKQILDKWAYFLNDNFESISNSTKSKEVEPLLTTLWDQDFPFNYSCPADPVGPGDHAYAGCVATAFTQISYYWRWPDHGRGYTSYLPATNPQYGVQFADFENTWYRYNEMADDPTTLNTAIAEYMYHWAVNFRMDFTPYGSAPNSSILLPGEDSTTYCFKYISDGFIYRDSMPDEQWKNLLVSELDNGYPLYYSGDPANPPGHAFVCDGYQDEDYFHFNLGWGGQSNGYYTIDDLAGFNYDQCCIPLLPDTLQYNYPLYAIGSDTLNTFEGSITDDSGPVHDYLNNTQASWLIDPQTEYDSITNITIMVKRLDLFNDGDNLSIYDGEDNSAPLLAELTGNVIPDDIESTGNKIFIEFITDGANTAPGFYLNYSTSRPTWCSGMTQLTEATATINDGSSSFYYNNQSSCGWIIDPGITDSLTLYFNYFDTEEENDILRIIDGVSQDILAEISGHYDDPPEPVTSPSGKMLLSFFSNNSVRAQGWEVWYDINLGLTENRQDVNFQIIPNPVTSDVKINFNLTSKQQVTIEVVDIVGHKQMILSDEALNPGHHSIHSNLGHLPEGIYFCCLQIGNEMVTKKIIKIK